MRKKAFGFSLVELMIAAAIMSIGVLGLVHTFRFITLSFQTQKYRILANNLAQEKIEVLKNYEYYQLQVTTESYVDTRFDPELVYDGEDGYYPYEDLTVSGIKFRRAVKVDFAAIQGTAVSTVSASSIDPGLKQITVYIIWRERQEDRYVQLSNLAENPNIAPLDATVTGVLNNTAGTLLKDGVVWVTENPNWYDAADASGVYSFAVHHGSYTLRVSSAGHFNQISDVVGINQGDTYTQNFTLTKMSLGTLSGYPWLNDKLLLSRVVGSTPAAAGYEQEWVEVFNPTTYTWTMTDVGLKFQRRADSDVHDIALDYVNTSIAPGGFFLFSNTNTVQAAGVTVAADATWSATNSTSDFPYFATDRDLIASRGNGGSEGSGAFRLYDKLTGATLDQVGWNRNTSAQTAPFYEGTPMPENIGLEVSEQYSRISSTAGVSTTYGPAYDSGTNSTDWVGTNPLSRIPRNTSTATQTVISGRPAVGAIASCNDGNSAAATASSSGSPPYAVFSIPNVATGTWTIAIASGSVFKQFTDVTIASNGQSVSVPNSATTPSSTWGAHSSLDTENENGYASGYVRDVSNNGLSSIYLESGSANTYTNASGFYFLNLSSGPQNLRANADLANAAYVEESEQIDIETGQIKTVNFTLSRGGTVHGYITSGTTPIPSINVVAHISGTQYGTGVTDASGTFYIYNLSTGTYTIEPALDTGSVADPQTLSATITSGASVDVGQFTVTSAYGTLSGSVTKSGASITSGVLVVVSSVTIPSTPPDINGSASLASDVYYMAASESDGTYEILVRGSTYYTYNVSAYYPTLGSNGAVTVSTKSVTGVSVSAGGTTTKNFGF